MTYPKTIEELDALPIGPEYSEHRHEITDAERAAGWACVMGRNVRICSRAARFIALPIMREFGAVYFEPDQPMEYTDREGVTWRISRYLDGEWFRYRAA